jgi:subtilisin family serine protease
MHAYPRLQSSLMSALKRSLWLAVCLCLLWPAAPASADTRLIVRVEGGLPVVQSVCQLLGCAVQYNLGDPQGQVFLVTTPLNLPLNIFLGLGVLDVEVDQTGSTLDAGGPPALYDSQPVNYYGVTVREGYVDQPAAQIINLAKAQSTFHVSGAGTVAVIDTGVDPTHPALQGVLVSGYDFTRNQAGVPDEKADITQSTTAVVDQSTTAVVDQSTTAVIDQYTANILNQPQYEAFGHGTMVSGVVHLVAPRTMIMPLKAFHADGTGYLSDVLRAIYFAVGHGANVLNMSFSFSSSSNELKSAITDAYQHGVVSVAAAGNNGQRTMVYPAGYSGMVMGVASTTNNDTQSTFTNYGPGLVWVAAPGEGVVTLYPYGTYAATWGTSFSTPFVAGTAALLLNVANANEWQAAGAIAHAKYINSNLGFGRLDVFQAVQAWRLALGLF